MKYGGRATQSAIRDIAGGNKKNPPGGLGPATQKLGFIIPARKPVYRGRSCNIADIYFIVRGMDQ